MRTAHSLTVPCSIRWGGGLPNPPTPDSGPLEPDHPPEADPPQADGPVNRMTHRCKNITLSQTSFTGGNKYDHVINYLQIVLITGAGRGIGKCLAKLFSECGAKVVLWDINDVSTIFLFMLFSGLTFSLALYCNPIRSNINTYPIAAQLVNSAWSWSVTWPRIWLQLASFARLRCETHLS